MRKQVERIQQRATLICDETRTYRVSCNITVYQKYVDTSGYGGKQYAPETFEVVGAIVPENLPGPTPVGQETNVLDFGNGRKLSINFRGQMLERFKGKPFSEDDGMTFFDTPLYRRLEEKQG